MKKLVLILIMIVFSVTQSVAGTIDAGRFNIQNGAIQYTAVQNCAVEMTVSKDHPAISQKRHSGATQNKECREKHSMNGENGTSPCPVDCLLFPAVKFASNIVSPGANDFVPLIPLTGMIIEASFRPPIS